MKDQEAIESEIKEWLEVIKPVQPRNAQATQRNRARFLSQAVSASELPRHKGWKLIFRKEQFPMKVLMSLFVMASLLFGGAVTVAAAQNDLPGESLYGLKIWNEDLSLRFQNPSEEKVDRLMELARVRVQEMAQIKDAGKAVPDQVPLRLEEHVQQALEICSTMDDPAMDRTLQKLQDQLRERDQDMERLQLRVHQASEPVLERTREMLQLRLQLVDQGLHDHEMFRAAARNGFRYGQQDDFTPPGQPEPGNGQQYGPPTSVPVSPNTMPGSPTSNPGGPNTTPGGPNLEPGGNMNGSGTGSAGNANDSGGNGYGGNESSGGKGGIDSGGGSGDNGYGGSGTGGGGGSGDGMGGTGNGGQGSDGGSGGGGSGGNRP